MSDIVPDSEYAVEINTLDSSEVGLSFRRKVEFDSGDKKKELDTPVKAIPAAKLYNEDQISDDARGANEFYAQVDSESLETSRNEGEAVHHYGLEKQIRWSRSEEFDFSFLEYNDAHQITELEAYQMAGIQSNYSDFFIVPRQKKLYSGVNSENGVDDGWYQKLRNGTEFFLQACHEHGESLPIMGAIPPLDLPHLEDLINLYELYDVFAFYVDFNWDNHPAKPDQIARMGYLMRRIRNQRIHEDVLFYALNARKGDFDKDRGYTPAADFATVTMGFDILGGNHATPDWPKEVFEQIEMNENFQVYRPSIMGYLDSPLDRLERNLPDKSTLDTKETLAKSTTSDAIRRRIQKIVNAELQALNLVELREALEKGETDEYLDERHVAGGLLDAGEAVREAFDAGAQATLGEWT
jgi:hypothetical protein